MLLDRQREEMKSSGPIDGSLLIAVRTSVPDCIYFSPPFLQQEQVLLAKVKVKLRQSIVLLDDTVYFTFILWHPNIE